VPSKEAQLRSSSYLTVRAVEAGISLGHGNGEGMTFLIVGGGKEEEQQLELGLAILARLRRGRTSWSFRPQRPENLTATARGWPP
jgi:hypothetical protein